MRRATSRIACLLFALCAAWPVTAAGSEPRELIGQLGSRSALVVLYSGATPDGGSRVTGEYLLLGTLQRRYLEGERSPELGVTTLKESTSPILFGRPATGSLQGIWKDGVFRGTRYGPGGQERERFEFSETFPPIAAQSLSVQCEASEGGYAANLGFVLEKGRMRPGSLSWTARHAPSGHVCVLGGTRIDQQFDQGRLRVQLGTASERCAIVLRDLGESLRIAAEGCSTHCGSQAYLEPMLIDRRGGCQLLRPVAR